MAHWATNNQESWNGGSIGDLMKYNEGIVPTISWEEKLAKIPGSTPIKKITEEENWHTYITDPQEIRAETIATIIDARNRGMTLEQYVNSYLDEDGKIMESAPSNLQKLGETFTIENLRKYLDKSLGLAPLIGLTSFYNNNNNNSTSK